MNVAVRAPRLAFVGTGWIGRNRMEAAARSGRVQIASVVDQDLSVARSAADAVCCATVGDRIEDALAADPDGVVLATPNALHAEQALAALEAGLPVFCQKPLARTAAEARRVVSAAERRDLCLGIDMSYRHVEAFTRARAELRGRGASVYAADLWFHNAYGPDKPWFTDRALSGGGCALDLATHMIDLALWFLDRVDEPEVSARLFHRGAPLRASDVDAEDYATIELDYRDAAIRISCSWFLSIGADAAIGASFYTPTSSVHVENVEGSYYDFIADRREGRTSTRLIEPPDEWGGRSLLEWSDRVARGSGFDPAVRDVVRVAEILDRVYGRPA